MKKFLVVIAALIISFPCVFLFSACSQQKEMPQVIEFKDIAGSAGVLGDVKEGTEIFIFVYGNSGTLEIYPQEDYHKITIKIEQWGESGWHSYREVFHVFPPYSSYYTDTVGSGIYMVTVLNLFGLDSIPLWVNYFVW